MQPHGIASSTLPVFGGVESNRTTEVLATLSAELAAPRCATTCTLKLSPFEGGFGTSCTLTYAWKLNWSDGMHWKPLQLMQMRDVPPAEVWPGGQGSQPYAYPER